MQNTIIQKAVHKDLNSILEITKDALNAMKAMNFHQWDENYPNEIVFQEDIQAQELLNFCENFALENHKASLRADTHSKNFPMNSLFKKLDFNFCGNFDIPNYQDPFLAYEKILNQKAF